MQLPSAARVFFLPASAKKVPDRQDDLGEPAGDEENHEDEDQAHEERPAVRDVTQIILEDDVDEGSQHRPPECSRAAHESHEQDRCRHVDADGRLGANWKWRV